MAACRRRSVSRVARRSSSDQPSDITAREAGSAACSSAGSSDQPGNAARVVYHGVGLRGDHRRDGPEEIRRKLDALVADAGIRERVLRMRQAFVRCDEERAAAAFVDRFLRERGRADGGVGRAPGFAGVGLRAE